MTNRLAFDLPPVLEAAEPPEARGLTRDGVRMLVAWRGTGRLVDSTFVHLPSFLDPGDLVVVNTSATIPAAIGGVGDGGALPVVLHLSTHLDADRWVVEPRLPSGQSTERWPTDLGVPPPRHILVGEGGAAVHLLHPYLDSDRLWVARLDLPQPALTWLAVNGRPVRYGYVHRSWPLAAYQNVYATEPGSAEMPSAGRPFTPKVITRLVAKVVAVAPVVLHTGVASLEADEVPYPERFSVPAATASLVRATRAAGGRVVAVGTTVVRALESAVDDATGEVQAAEGWTDLVVTPDRGVRAVDGLLTGWHEPEASHLLMLEAIAGRDLLDRSYDASLANGYLWHEFGDVHLLLP
ncbi:MAG TPA: S-adenosylmethionine:tRNA ribosyltransferase-isomerase [Acidimicrobiales bacterium]|nr:S-adenosylmethionine:tRNA ribosyltransferase-isomerase [Acidimicrobiales bacterium]